MLKAPSEEDLGLVLSMRFRYFLNRRVVESHRSGERTPCLVAASASHAPSLLQPYPGYADIPLTSSKIPLSSQILTMSGCRMKG